MRNPTLDWGLMRELDASGVRVESHGIAHRPLAEVTLDEAVREIAVSKLKLEEQLGRPVRAYAYVKGSEAHFHPVHESILKQAGYEIAFTSISRANGVEHEPVPPRPLQRRAVPGADVRARALRRLRPDLPEGHRRRDARAAPVQPGARHRHAVRVVEYDPSRRGRRRRPDGARLGAAAHRGRARLVLRAKPGAPGLGAARRGGRADGRRRWR